MEDIPAGAHGTLLYDRADDHGLWTVALENGRRIYAFEHDLRDAVDEVDLADVMEDALVLT